MEKKRQGTYSIGREVVGKTALVPIARGMDDSVVVHFPVTIKDYKNTYGKDRYLVIPVGGKGEFWAQNLTLTS